MPVPGERKLAPSFRTVSLSLLFLLGSPLLLLLGVGTFTSPAGSEPSAPQQPGRSEGDCANCEDTDTLRVKEKEPCQLTLTGSRKRCCYMTEIKLTAEVTGGSYRARQSGIEITSDGNRLGTIPPNQSTLTVKPRASGKNVFRARLTNSDIHCEPASYTAYTVQPYAIVLVDGPPKAPIGTAVDRRPLKIEVGEAITLEARTEKENGGEPIQDKSIVWTFGGVYNSRNNNKPTVKETSGKRITISFAGKTPGFYRVGVRCPHESQDDPSGTYDALARIVLVEKGKK